MIMVYKKGNTPWWIIKGVEHPGKSKKAREKNRERTLALWGNQEYKKHMKLVHAGQHSSPKTEFKKGQKSWIKGTGIQTNTGKTHFKKGMTPWNKGIKFLQITGAKHFNWKGGNTEAPSKKIKTTLEYKKWRQNVFRKDNFFCQSCNGHSGKLEAYHLYSKKKYPEFRFEPWNGQTLCKECHTHLHNELGRS